ncbi:hypothetical protein ABE24_18305 [Cytobacillus firmus]|nr:hypothetical protein [Cytobacillus firmus]MBG9656579.1 hypothetical protein [Cytobacillus firmus]MBG9656684.1 hypothetical protein [Cytobacillus firmus]MBG9656878.1 hypothetical protein [Cytobacillus firmus]
MAFLVRGAGRIPSPCCGKSMSVIGTRNRKSKKSSGESCVYSIRRLECDQCEKIHHELPDFLVPYKRYESECIEAVLSNPNHHDIPADESTLFRWFEWFHSLIDYWIGCLISIMHRTKQENIPLDLTSENPETALQRLGRLVGDAPGWLGRFVRPIVNINLWLHTRSAFLSELG